jgi:hypothetical protein
MAWSNSLRVAATAAGLIAALTPASAAAVAPPNDSAAGATVIRSLPFSDTLDTVEATVDADEAALASACFGDVPTTAFAHAVWYAFTPPEDQAIVIDPTASRPGVGIAIVTGTPGAFSLIDEGCRIAAPAVALAAHTTYYIVLLGQDSGRGSTVRLAVAEPGPPRIAATINRVARWVNGTAVLSGTISCAPASFPTFGMTVVQAGPRNTRVVGVNDFSPEPFCDGTPQPWSLFAGSLEASFKPGNATATLKINACSFSCEVVETTRRVQLRQDRSGPGRGGDPPERPRRPRHPEPAA